MLFCNVFLFLPYHHDFISLKVLFRFHQKRRIRISNTYHPRLLTVVDDLAADDSTSPTTTTTD